MKSVRWAAIVLCLLFTPLFSRAEYINTFDAAIEVRQNGSFEVTETIEYVFTEPKHGIYRYIPTSHPDKPTRWYFERYLDITLEEVLVNGEAVPFTLDDGKDVFKLRIGDPDTTIEGPHTYTIRYVVDGGLLYHQYQGAELYWNVTGSEWDVEMRQVRARVSADSSLLTPVRSCYRGVADRTSSCERVSEEDGTAVFFARNLAPGEEITIAQEINVTKVEKVVKERLRFVFFGIAGLILWFMALGVFVYRYRTEHETGNPIIPEYEPYPDTKPMYAGLLIDGRLDPRDITAGIVYLAEQGYLKIRKTDRTTFFFFTVDDYEITLLRSLDDTMSRFEHSILSLLFEHGALPGTTISLSDLKQDLAHQRENQKTMQSLRKDLEKDLESRGFFQVNLSTTSFVVTLFTSIVIVIFGGSLLVHTLPTGSIFLGVLVVGTILLLGAARRRRTLRGYEALDHLKGFKEFLSVTDRDRFEFHNAPEKSPEQFMEYLPYAIAFGVEEKWAEVFADVTIPDPSWYDGGGTSFSAMNLSTSLGAFSTAFAASSGSSAASGGGRAGGGGGGGGGGSW